MKQLTTEEIRGRILELLVSFVNVCKENNFKYYLAYGSILGAVRHGGFIPWDDDVDILMPREDYNRFLDFCEKENVEFDCFSYEKTLGYQHYYVKIADKNTVLKNKYMKDDPKMGLFIDIFPMDEVKLNADLSAKYEKKITRCTKLLEMTVMKAYWPAEGFIQNIVKKAVYTVTVALGNDYWQKRLNKIIVKAAGINNGNAKQYMFGWSVLEQDMFGEGKPILFEGMEVIGPSDADKYLTRTYGDYMKLPPVEKQVSEHDFEAFLKESI